jgi:4-alpha-glucanotransferase
MTSLPRHNGILLHPTSLPGPHGSGDLGPAAYHFVDWLVGAGQSLWQVLPLGSVGPGNSPYISPSAFAGSELLIDLGQLRDAGWLSDADLKSVPAFPARPGRLRRGPALQDGSPATCCQALLWRQESSSAIRL